MGWRVMPSGILHSNRALLSTIMSRYRDPPSRADRTKAIAAVAAIHLALAALALGGQRTVQPRAGQPATQLIDVALPPPPPPPPPAEPQPSPARQAGTTRRKADPTPIVVPPPKIALPAAPSLPAAPVAGTGSAASSGSGAVGTGPGAGDAGAGAGGGGNGTGGGIGEDARLLSGGLERRDYRRLRSFDARSGRAVIALLIGPDGRVAQCSMRQSSGDPALDAALCAILQPRMRWAPARDRGGRPLTVGINYTAIWNRD